MHCTLYSLCTVLCTHYALYLIYSVLTMHCTHHTLYSLCTVHTIHCTHPTLLTPLSLCTLLSQHSPCIRTRVACTHAVLLRPPLERGGGGGAAEQKILNGYGEGIGQRTSNAQPQEVHGQEPEPERRKRRCVGCAVGGGLAVGIQVHKVEAVSQSKSSNVWI
jgi:hypothetical protein